MNKKELEFNEFTSVDFIGEELQIDGNVTPLRQVLASPLSTLNPLKDHEKNSPQFTSEDEQNLRNFKLLPSDLRFKTLVDLASYCLRDKFLCYQIEGAGRVIYKITDQDKMEVLVCRTNEELVSLLISECKKRGSIVPTREIKNALEYWKLNCTPIASPPSDFALPISQFEPSITPSWTFKRIDIVPKEGPTPAWDEFLNRLSSKEDFLAFIGSIFDPKHKGRQALYLHGPAGQDGKSCVIRAIESILGQENVAALSNIALKNQSQFLTSSLEGKRLAVYPDCKNTKFVMSEIFRSIVSGDTVPIERKGQDAITKRLYCRVIIASNHRPELTSGGADLSRLILIHVEPSKKKNDPLWEDRLIAELPQLLDKANLVYKQKCPNSGDIRLSDETLELNQQAAGDFEERWGDIFEEYLECAPGEDLPAGDMKKYVTDLNNLTTHEVGKFKTFLETKGFPQKNNNGRSYVGLRLKKLRKGDGF